MGQTEKWSVGLISTSKDLDTERCSVISYLEKSGFKVVSFEGGNFIINTEEDKNTACISAFDNIDIAIIIIGDELGYSNDKIISITQKEYEHVADLGKYRFIFVKKTTWEIYQNPKRKGFIKSAPFLDYINDVQKDFINQFNDIVHLLALIKAKLEGLSLLLLKSIAESQYTKLMNSITIPSIGNAVSEQLKFFLTPAISPSKDIFGKTIDSSCLYRRLTKTNTVKHIIVCGEIGSGKSMLLYKNYTSHFSEFQSSIGVRIPLFLSLRGKTKDYSIQCYFSECFEYHLGITLYPMFTFDSKSFVLYVDGIDEMSNINVRNDISSWFCVNFNIKFMLMSCRTEFFNNYVNESSLGSSIDLKIFINNWNAGITKEYITNFLKDKPLIRDYAIKWVDNHLSNWMQTPLLISVICFLLKEIASCKGAEQVLNNIMNEITLMKQYTSLFIKRELKRSKQDEPEDVGAIYEELMKTAWQFYIQKQNGGIQNFIPKSNANFWHSEITKAYLGITEVNDFYTYSVHEYFIDFLVAIYVLDELNKSTTPGFFDYMLTADINKLIFQGFEGFPEDRQLSVLSNLSAEYFQALYNNEENIKRRTHIVYYLSRIKGDTNEKQLKDILYRIEKEVEIKLSICFGMIKLGNLEVEDFLYHQIETDLEWDKTNRGYHLLYYKDVERKEVPYLDENNSGWSKTFFALKNHICNAQQYYYLARIDLQIIKKFINSHKNHYFTTVDFDDFERCINDIYNKKDPFCEKVIMEWKHIKDILKDRFPEVFGNTLLSESFRGE